MTRLDQNKFFVGKTLASASCEPSIGPQSYIALRIPCRQPTNPRQSATPGELQVGLLLRAATWLNAKHLGWGCPPECCWFGGFSTSSYQCMVTLLLLQAVCPPLCRLAFVGFLGLKLPKQDLIYLLGWWDACPNQSTQSTQLNQTQINYSNSNQSIPISLFISVISQALWNNLTTCWTNQSIYQSAYPPTDLPLSISLSSAVLLTYLFFFLLFSVQIFMSFFFLAVFLHIFMSLFLPSCHQSSHPSINLAISKNTTVVLLICKGTVATEKSPLKLWASCIC